MSGRDTESVSDLADSCIKALSGISSEERASLADRILKARTVFVFGVGRSGLVAQMFAVRLVQLGLKVYFIGDMTTPLITSEDLVILISNSGDTMSVVKTAEIAERIGTPVVSISGSGDNTLAQNTDMNIAVESEGLNGEKAPLGTVFEDATILFLDSIIPDLMSRIGTDESGMRSRHAIWV